jgi:hypothetical protein
LYGFHLFWGDNPALPRPQTCPLTPSWAVQAVLRSPNNTQMDISDQRPKLEDEDRRQAINGSTPYPANGYVADSGSSSGGLSGYTLMVAGRRTGKTSFLRLLLDTCDISPSASKDQLASVAKFVQGSSGHTSHIRTASIDIEVDVEGNGQLQRLALSLVDTPSMDFQDETSAERLLSEMLRHVDSRFAEGVEDVSALTMFLSPLFLTPYSRIGRRRPGTTTFICESSYSRTSRHTN